MGYEVVVLAFSSEDGPIWTMRPSFVIALPHPEWVDASRPSVETISSFEEGSRRYLLATRYERSASARQAALEAHGSVRGFDFQQVYGDLGKGFIEVHHIDPVHRGSCKPTCVPTSSPLFKLSLDDSPVRGVHASPTSKRY